MSFHHEAGEWPWDYDARQEFALDERGLSLRLTCRNASGEPMPCGLGQHPYFHCGPKPGSTRGSPHAWTIDEHVLPVEKVPADGPLRPARPPGVRAGPRPWLWRLGRRGADERSRTGRSTLRMSSPDARFFQLYSPPTGGIFVAEPVTHANAALNAPEERWPELGMRVLEPGEDDEPRHAARGHPEIAAVQVEACEIALI